MTCLGDTNDDPCYFAFHTFSQMITVMFRGVNYRWFVPFLDILVYGERIGMELSCWQGKYPALPLFPDISERIDPGIAWPSSSVAPCLFLISAKVNLDIPRADRSVLCGSLNLHCLLLSAHDLIGVLSRCT